MTTVERVRRWRLQNRERYLATQRKNDRARYWANLEKARAKNRAKLKAMRAANPDAVRERDRARYAARTPDQIAMGKANRSAWHESRADEINARIRDLRKQKPEHSRAMQRASYERRRDKVMDTYRSLTAKEREEIRAKVRAHHAMQPHKNSARIAVRRARKMNAMPAWADRKAIAAIYAKAKVMTKTVGIRMSVDHRYPLKGKGFSGLHLPWNLQILPHSENSRKGNNVPPEALHPIVNGTLMYAGLAAS